ncbi:MAG: hypothetical protein Q9212_007116 [Teloschistes hypoglaucus]
MFFEGHPYVTVQITMNHSRFADLVVSLEYYTAPPLSHVWAKTKPLMTIRSSVQDHSDRVPWDRLSPAIREAVTLTCALGFEYIWIDSLCIIQNDEKEWESELTRMGIIFGNAAIVLAAHGPDLGLSRAPLQPIQDASRPEDNAVYCRQQIDHWPLFSASESTESWFGRAWCMQERILARRIIHFGEELSFECNTSIECECSWVNATRIAPPDGRTLKARVASARALIKEQPDSLHTVYELWGTYVTFCKDYSARGVTYATDTLPAVSALMASLAPYFGNYYAGLWQSHLLLCLQWQAWDTRACCRHKSYVAPSFSWASRSGAVRWVVPYTSKVPSGEFAAVIEVACTLASEDPFGGVSGGHITLRGRTTEMSIASKALDDQDRLKMIKDGSKECYVKIDSMDDMQEAYPGMMVTCLDVMRDRNDPYVSSLVILPVDPQRKQFRRIGFSRMLKEVFSEASEEEITIV